MKELFMIYFILGLIFYTFSVFIILISWFLFKTKVEEHYRDKTITNFNLFMITCVFWPVAVYGVVTQLKRKKMKENKNKFLKEKVNKPNLYKDESSVLYNWYGKPNEITKPVLFFCAGVTITIIVVLIIQRFF